jgi:hypothetical protein
VRRPGPFKEGGGGEDVCDVENARQHSHPTFINFIFVLLTTLFQLPTSHSVEIVHDELEGTWKEVVKISGSQGDKYKDGRLL